MHRTRAERFDDLVLLAVSQLEPRWEAELSGIEFAVEEIPPAGPDLDDPDPDPVPLARLELPGSAPAAAAASPTAPSFELPDPLAPAPPDSPAAEPLPARIVLYRRPLMARADGEEELAELVLDVVVEQFAHWLGVDPQIVDPGYPGDE